MAEKVLFQTELNQLATSDLEGLGAERRDEKGNVYRWVKNCGSTSVVEGSPVLKMVTSVLAAVNKKVISPDGQGAATASLAAPAGLARTGIAKSGSATGDHGWVMVKGNTSTAYVYQAVTALTVGMWAAVTSTIYGVTYAFDKPTPATYDAQHKAILMAAVATTGAATAANCTAIHVNFE